MGCAIIYDNIGIKLNSLSGIFNGEMLRMGRQMRGLSLGELAKSMSLRRDHLREIELGIRPVTEYEIVKFSEYLDFPKLFFFTATYIKEFPTKVFICGEGIKACANCGQASDYLCDYPVGEGKTCDLPICKSCRTHVGKYDFCPIHEVINRGISRI